MLVISSREFRANQKSYLDKADEGAQILIQRGKNKSYRLVPVVTDETLISKKEFFAEIERSREQYKKGKFTRVETKVDLKDFLKSL